VFVCVRPSPIVYGIHCNKWGSGENNRLRNNMGDEGGEGGA